MVLGMTYAGDDNVMIDKVEYLVGKIKKLKRKTEIEGIAKYLQGGILGIFLWRKICKGLYICNLSTVFYILSFYVSCWSLKNLVFFT